MIVGGLCATGDEAAITGVASGVLRTLVLANGSVRISGAFQGRNEYDDLPTDGVVDATGTFVLTFRDVFFASGREIHTETLPGTVTDLPPARNSHSTWSSASYSPRTGLRPSTSSRSRAPYRRPSLAQYTSSTVQAAAYPQPISALRR
jgi:hypothetical protein